MGFGKAITQIFCPINQRKMITPWANQNTLIWVHFDYLALYQHKVDDTGCQQALKEEINQVNKEVGKKLVCLKVNIARSFHAIISE